jgi:hypothetical protein
MFHPFWRCCQRSRFSGNHRNFFHHHHRLMFNSNHGRCLSMASGSLWQRHTGSPALLGSTCVLIGTTSGAILGRHF